MKNEEMHKSEGYVRQWMRTEDMEAEAGNEFTLPDYLPPIRRILRTETAILPAGSYISGERAEFAGSAVVTLVYTDPEGGITAVPLSSDYEYAVKDTHSLSHAVSEEFSEGTYCRPQGPRRVLLRTKVHGRTSLFSEEFAKDGKALLPEDIAAEDAEILEGKGMAVKIRPYASGEISLSETVMAEGILPEDMKVLWCRGEVRVLEASAEEAAIRAKGDLHLSCMVQVGEGTLPFSFQTAVPWEETIPAEEVSSDMLAVCRGVCHACEVSVSENGQGGSAITFDAAFELHAEALKNAPFRYVKDLYAKSRALHCKQKKKKIASLVGGKTQSVSLSATTPCHSEEDGMPLSVLDVSARLTKRDTTCLDGYLLIEGEWEAQMILSGEGEGLTLFPFCAKLPFRVEMPLAEARKGDTARITLSVVCPRAKIDEDRFALSADLNIAAAVLRQTEIEEAEEALPTEEEETPAPTASRIILYYPGGEDSLWDVGKKYKVSLASLIAANGLSEDASENADIPHELAGMNYLYVEKNAEKA